MLFTLLQMRLKIIKFLGEVCIMQFKRKQPPNRQKFAQSGHPVQLVLDKSIVCRDNVTDHMWTVIDHVHSWNDQFLCKRFIRNLFAQFYRSHTGFCSKTFYLLFDRNFVLMRRTYSNLFCSNKHFKQKYNA
jgi:hypothetical protein